MNGFFHARRSVRLSAACAALEMCALGEDEEALSPRVRCTREHIADSCGWGAEAVVDEILGRLQQEVLGAGGINESGLSPLHSPLASPMAKARGVKHARGKSPAASEKSDGTGRPRTGGSHGSVQHRAGTSTAGSHTSRGTHGDGKPPQAAGGGRTRRPTRLCFSWKDYGCCCMFWGMFVLYHVACALCNYCIS